MFFGLKSNPISPCEDPGVGWGTDPGMGAEQIWFFISRLLFKLRNRLLNGEQAGGGGNQCNLTSVSGMQRKHGASYTHDCLDHLCSFDIKMLNFYTPPPTLLSS